MVEAVGIEPTSEEQAPEEPTCVVGGLLSQAQGRPPTGSLSPQPIGFRLPA